MNFKDIWNLVVTGDTSDVKGKLSGLGKTAEETGATVETSFRGRMGGALSNFAQKIPGVSGLMDKFGVSSSQAGALLGTAVAAGAAGAGLAVEKFVAASVTEFQTQAQAVLHFKEVTGLLADEASRFVAVADDYEVSAEDLSGAIGKLDKTAGTTPDNLKKLGVEIAHNKDGAYDAQQTFLNVVDAYNSTDDASTRAAIAQGAFGKQWQGLVKLLDVGSGQIRTSLDGVKDYQLFSDADLKKSEDYRHSLDDLNDAVKGIERAVGEALVPALAEAARFLTDTAESADKTLSPLGGLAGTMEKAATAAKIATWPIKEMFNVVGEGKAVARVFKGAWEDVFGDGGDGGRLRKSIDAAATAAEHMGRSGDISASAARGAAIAAAAHRREVEASISPYREFAQGMAIATDAINAQRAAADKARQSLSDLRDQAKGLVDDQLGLEGAIYSAMDAIDAYTEKTKDHTASLRDVAEAGLDAEKSFKAVSDQALITAESQATLNGTTLTAGGAVDAQVLALRDLEATLDPKSPLRRFIDEYIGVLYTIPGHLTTQIDVNGKDIVSAISQYEIRNGSGWRN